MKVDRGFSLIELLVATAVLTMVLMVSTLGYSFFMERWAKERNNFSDTAREAKRLLLTREAISALYPYILRDEQNQPVIYFEGNRDSLVGVTSRSMFVEGEMAIVRLSIEQAADLSYSLHYEEHILDQRPLTSLSQDIRYEYKVRLMAGVSQLEFFYYGVEGLQEKVSGGKRQWWDTFNALARRIMPDRIRVSYIYSGERQELDLPINGFDSRVLALFDDSNEAI